jgi:predicted amino acid-binding ACT domain protein
MAHDERVAKGHAGRYVMNETIRSVEYGYVTVPDKPGSGADVLSALQEGGVNLLAYLGFPASRGKSQIDLVPEDPVAFRQVAKQAGLRLSRAKRAFLVQGDDRTGAVAVITRRLAEAKINVTAAAATAAGVGRYGMILWVLPKDFKKAARVLGA